MPEKLMSGQLDTDVEIKPQLIHPEAEKKEQNQLTAQIEKNIDIIKKGNINVGFYNIVNIQKEINNSITEIDKDSRDEKNNQARSIIANAILPINNKSDIDEMIQRLSSEYGFEFSHEQMQKLETLKYIKSDKMKDTLVEIFNKLSSDKKLTKADFYGGMRRIRSKPINEFLWKQLENNKYSEANLTLAGYLGYLFYDSYRTKPLEDNKIKLLNDILDDNKEELTKDRWLCRGLVISNCEPILKRSIKEVYPRLDLENQRSFISDLITNHNSTATEFLISNLSDPDQDKRRLARESLSLGADKETAKTMIFRSLDSKENIFYLAPLIDSNLTIQKIYNFNTLSEIDPKDKQKIITGLTELIKKPIAKPENKEDDLAVVKSKLIDEHFYHLVPKLLVLLNDPKGFELLDELIENNKTRKRDTLTDLRFLRHPNGFETVLKILKKIELNSQLTQTTLIGLVNMYDAEVLRDKLNNIFLSTKSEVLKTNINNLLALLNPEPEGKEAKQIHKDLRDQYNTIDFKEYDLNKIVNSMELDFLKEEIKPDEKTLDLGCGTGRHLIPLKKAGYEINGLDYVPKHVADIKKENSDIKDIDVQEGNWLDTPYDSKSYNGIFILGRSILHEFRFDRQLALFFEVNRILKLGGKFIFDVPNREVGIYKERVADYKEQMQKRGIKYFRYGTIYDAPDTKNYITRYAFSQDDIKKLTNLTGFEIITDSKREQIKNDKGEVEIENIYYILKKVKDINHIDNLPTKEANLPQAA